MYLKPIFIQKEVSAPVFSWQLSEIYNNNSFEKRKKALLWEKKHCYKKRGSDICRKSNYATFYVTSLSHKKRKDSLETRAEPVVFSL